MLIPSAIDQHLWRSSRILAAFRHPAASDAQLPSQVFPRSLERIFLLGCGVLAAACVTLIDLHLRLPGHAILKGALPIALGLACVPRRGAGVAMSGAAALTTWGFRAIGYGEKGLGSMTSLLTLGPACDLALLYCTGRYRTRWAFALAGMASNLLAFAIQSYAKTTGLPGGGGQSMGAWLMIASWSYPLCGCAAGLISAWLCFRGQPQSPHETRNDRA